LPDFPRSDPQPHLRQASCNGTNHAASRSKRTRHPSAVAMFTRASSENRDTRPRSSHG
jgi:hypothetical protein